MGANTSNLHTVIRLNSKNIKDLRELKQPHLLPVFTKLQTILLDKNKISSIPPEIAQDIPKAPKLIEYLVEVNFSSNKLSSLPEEFFLLINLERLYLDKNEFSEFPRGVLSLYALQELTLHKNKLKELPWDINRLRNLKTLNIKDNEFQFLPVTLSKMHNLQVCTLLPNSHISYANELSTALATVSHHNSLTTVLFDFLSKKDLPPPYKLLKENEEKLINDEQNKMTADGKLLWKLLRDQAGFSALKEYMQKEHNHENILFWREIRKFTQKYYSDREIRSQALISDAMSIFKDFIAEDSKYTINLSAAVMAKLRSVFTDPFHFPSGINQWVFNESFEQSFALMERDMFRRFKVTEESKDLIKRLEAQSIEKAESQVW